jgi:hypothetical protein
MRDRWRWLVALVLAVAGCRTPAPDLKPPPQKEEYNIPPENDPRYDKPYDYPKDSDPNNPMRKSSLGGAGPITPARSVGRTPGMGGF